LETELKSYKLFHNFPVTSLPAALKHECCGGAGFRYVSIFMTHICLAHMLRRDSFKIKSSKFSRPAAPVTLTASDDSGDPLLAKSGFHQRARRF
jgi:hypothetical protein